MKKNELENPKKVSKKGKDKGKKKNKKVKKESYFYGVKQELGKVTWPSKHDVIKYSIATIVLIIILVVFFLLLSLLMSAVKGVFN